MASVLLEGSWQHLNWKRSVKWRKMALTILIVHP